MEACNISMPLPASLQAYGNAEKVALTVEHLNLMLRGWVASPMVEFEGGGQNRLDIFDTIHNVQNVVNVACWGDKEETWEAVNQFVMFHSDQQEALTNFKKIFQGYVGSLVVEQAGDGEKRAQVADTYFELQRLTRDLFATA